jgi:hypothetical protein
VPAQSCNRIALLLVATLHLAACSQDSDEERVRGVIEAAEKAVEARDSSDVMKLISDHYRDSQGNDKASLQQFLHGYFLTHPKIEALVRISDIEIVTPTRAQVRVEFALIGTQLRGSSGTALSGESEALRVELRLVDSSWLIARIDRERP